MMFAPLNKEGLASKNAIGKKSHTDIPIYQTHHKKEMERKKCFLVFLKPFIDSMQNVNPRVYKDV